MDFAIAAGVRLPTLEANSGVMFMNIARSVTSRRRRSRSSCGGVRRPQAHVGLPRAGGDLADEGRAGGGADREGAARVPQEVDAERHAVRLALGDDAGHRGGGLKSGLQLVGPVVLVAEEDRVEPRVEQHVHVPADGRDRAGEAGVGVVERRPWQGRDVRHRDQRLAVGEDGAEAGHGRSLLRLVIACGLVR